VVVVGEAGFGADGSDDHVTSDFGFGAALDYTIEGEAEIFAAEGEEAEGVGVPEQGGFGDSVLPRDGQWATPLEEVFFDLLAVGMMADLAFAAVAVF
jgi:hypothetical protein